MAELQAGFTSPSSLPRAPIAGTRSSASVRVLFQTKVAPHKSHTRGWAVLWGKAAAQEGQALTLMKEALM